MRRTRLLSSLKNYVVPDVRKPREILTGPFKGIVMNLSLRSQSQVVLGLFEKETHTWLRRLSKNLATAIDIGAAHGEYTLFFLKRTNATKIYAFEPDLNSVPILVENLRLNGIEQSTRLDLSTKLVGLSNTDHEIQLDSLAASIQPPCLIKMDVDGAEEDILKGTQRLNRLSGVRWLIETHSKDLETACLEILNTAGFQTRIIQNAWWRMFLPELRPSQHNRWLAAWRD
jgi:ribosomal protein L11 methylase PrmA